jgi:hypothetical protein
MHRALLGNSLFGLTQDPALASALTPRQPAQEALVLVVAWNEVLALDLTVSLFSNPWIIIGNSAGIRYADGASWWPDACRS